MYFLELEEMGIKDCMIKRFILKTPKNLKIVYRALNKKNKNKQ